MIFYLKSYNSDEIKNSIDASNKKYAEEYFASLLNLDKNVLLKIFYVQEKK
tara:strand:- start:383 stop:535 length:153 start_codon:yes stop_codon:yes gene_type:complete